MAETNGLLNRRTGKSGTEGSNPSISAKCLFYGVPFRLKIGIKKVTLAQARDKATLVRPQIEAGIDPVFERRKELGIPTFREAARAGLCRAQEELMAEIAPNQVAWYRLVLQVGRRELCRGGQRGAQAQAISEIKARLVDGFKADSGPQGGDSAHLIKQLLQGKRGKSDLKRYFRDPAS